MISELENSFLNSKGAMFLPSYLHLHVPFDLQLDKKHLIFKITLLIHVLLMNMTGLISRFLFIFIRITLVYDDEYHELIARHMLPVFLLY